LINWLMLGALLLGIGFIVRLFMRRSKESRVSIYERTGPIRTRTI
jgi:hypothetical protein